MAFGDRYTEFLAVLVLISVTVGISAPVLREIGYVGWHLALAIIGCVVVSYLLVILLLNIKNIIEWVRGKIGHDR